MSIFEYLTSLIEHGHTPGHISTCQIGRTVYAVGEFTTPERDAPEGSPMHKAGLKMNAEQRLALTPCYRTDWVTRDSAGPTPSLLPASYRRSTNVVYADATGSFWYVQGWTKGSDIMWLGRVPAWMEDEIGERNTRVVSMGSWHWGVGESYETAVKLSKREGE